MTECFYCGLPPAGPMIHGVETVAHRACAHERVVEIFSDKWPQPPKNNRARARVLAALREAGVTPEEVWG